MSRSSKKKALFSIQGTVQLSPSTILLGIRLLSYTALTFSSNAKVYDTTCSPYPSPSPLSLFCHT